MNLFDRFSPRVVRWFGLGLALALGYAAVRERDGCLAALVTLAFGGWVLSTIIGLVTRVWRRAAYRVSTRFLASFALVGCTPFLLVTLLVAVVGYVVVGQYAAVRSTRGEERLLDDLLRRAELTALEITTDPDAARRRLERPVDPIALQPEWLLVAGGEQSSSEGLAGKSMPPVEAPFAGVLVDGESTWIVAIARSGDGAAGLFLPIDRSASEALSLPLFYEVRLLVEEVTRTKGGVQIDVDEDDDQLEAAWFSFLGDEPHLLDRLRVIWFRVGRSAHEWATGAETDPVQQLVVLLKVPVGAAIRDLFDLPPELAQGFARSLAVLGNLLALAYLVAVVVALAISFAVTRAVSRLAAGARAVSRGDLDHRIPVKRRDQLGDLAQAFNGMTDSVQEMLSKVGEQERLARDVELAREIQQSLLPAPDLVHGRLEVHALYRPASEVSGDYFDLFPLGPGRLIVAVGDVAGHGLATGLVMAMVKSAVASLVAEGHRGPTLLGRLNELLSSADRHRLMVTLVLIEIDLDQGKVRVTSAGHPPPYLLSPDRPPEEIEVEGLPLGHRWPSEPRDRIASLVPGSRLFVFSDGLVEATDAASEPLGWDRLQELLATSPSGGTGSELLRIVEQAADEWTGGRPLEDDLTLLVIEHRDDPVS